MGELFEDSLVGVGMGEPSSDDREEEEEGIDGLLLDVETEVESVLTRLFRF